MKNRALKADRVRLRKAILAQLGRQQMTFLELADELEHVAPKNVIRRELLGLVGADLVCSMETSGKDHDLFETWERALGRVRDNRGRHTIKARSTRPGRRVA